MQPYPSLECKQLPQEKVILAGMPASPPLPLPVPPGCLRHKVSGQSLVTADGGASPRLPASHRGAQRSTSEALKAGDHRDSGLCYQKCLYDCRFQTERNEYHWTMPEPS